MSAERIAAADIKARAQALGFDLCGIARADDYAELAVLRDWLARGYAGDMAWMHRSADRRADVRHVVPGARSVIVTGTLYNTDRPDSRDLPAGIARISRYAGGRDYHDVLEERLDALLAWMRERSPEPFDAKRYVDTGPVQERVYAQHAGIGWIGKNTCLINPEIGSWIFLGEIICTLAIEADTEALDGCGSCTRCLDACPTGALVEPGTLDSTRCISYLSIELRTAIPEGLRAAMGGHVYGCDICQEVCPYNRPAPRSADAAWQPKPGLDLPGLVELWQHSDADLRALVRHTAMTRAKLPGFRRNIAVAIGNSGDPDAIGALDDGAGASDRVSVRDGMVQDHVRWARSRTASS